MRVVALAKRLAILADCDEGIGTGKVAAKHGVSGTFVRNLKKERRETGTLRGPRKRGKGRKPKIDRIRVQELVAADADATLAELRERLGVRCSLSALWSVLHDLKITFKKKRFGRLSKIGRTSPSGASPGVPGKSGSIRAGSSSSMKPGRRQT
jgi:transposase